MENLYSEIKALIENSNNQTNPVEIAKKCYELYTNSYSILNNSQRDILYNLMLMEANEEMELSIPEIKKQLQKIYER